MSPDWTISTMRQAIAPTGLGSATKSKAGKKMRAKMGRRFWLKAGLYYGVGINILNYLNRKDDMEENPELYPDKDDYNFWDYTMYGNSIGNQTRLFMGRYKDGTERYLRWGKQFREFPELLFDDTGFNFPQAALKKLGSKASPLAQTGSQIFTGKSLNGFENYDLKDRKKLEYTFGLAKLLMKTALPFATGSMLRKDKEWKALDIAVPSSKGITGRKASELLEISLVNNDTEMMRQVFIACARNKINPEDIFKNTTRRLIVEYRNEETRLLKDIDEILAKVNDPSTRPQDRDYLMNKIKDKQKNVLMSKIPQKLFKKSLIDLIKLKKKYPDIFGEITKEDKERLKSMKSK